MNDLRIAWILTATPAYWHPVLSELTRLFQQTMLFTAGCFQFTQGFERTFKVEVVGQRRVISLRRSPQGYNPSIMYLPLGIIGRLLRFQPQVVFADGFCLWTILVLLLKAWTKWRVVLICDGSSPTVDYHKAKLRLYLRRIMLRAVDSCITNTTTGKRYLVETLGANPDQVFVKPYLVADQKALLQSPEISELNALQLKHPVFLFVGQIIPRKGVRELLTACSILAEQGITDYTLLIIGEGWEQQTLEALTQQYQLESCVKWIGKVEYNALGYYYQYADIFVFPTHEDVWGTVVPEAMAFGKPVLCSQAAGSAELVVEGKNGYCFDPNAPAQLAELMSRLITQPQLIPTLGSKASQLISQHSPAAAAAFFAKVITFVLDPSISELSRCEIGSDMHS